MTHFRRDGHYRTSKYGKRYYVDTHTVERNRWPSHSRPAAVVPLLTRYPEIGSGRCSTACFIVPNAHCPVCGEPVFYYQNERGSRVFFDELGPPWPKHPCTDSSTHTLTEAKGGGLRMPQARTKNEVDEIGYMMVLSQVDPAAHFRTRYGGVPWPLATIRKRIKSGRFVFLVLQTLDANKPKKVYVSCESLPSCCKEGFCVAINRRKLSLFCTSTMKAREVQLKRFRSAAAFIEGLTGQD